MSVRNAALRPCVVVVKVYYILKGLDGTVGEVGKVGVEIIVKVDISEIRFRHVERWTVRRRPAVWGDCFVDVWTVGIVVEYGPCCSEFVCQITAQTISQGYVHLRPQGSYGGFKPSAY